MVGSQPVEMAPCISGIPRDALAIQMAVVMASSNTSEDVPPLVSVETDMG